jgi:hypothetical protein
MGPENDVEVFQEVRSVEEETAVVVEGGWVVCTISPINPYSKPAISDPKSRSPREKLNEFR